jgi:hypothetical protein
VGKFVEAAFEPAADEREQAFEILEALREAGGFDEGTAIVALQFHLGMEEEAARGYLGAWQHSGQ